LLVIEAAEVEPRAQQPFTDINALWGLTKSSIDE
jgi:hypothetical protein